jgi:predicted aldo/keto reductase-like oxidoreductase
MEVTMSNEHTGLNRRDFLRTGAYAAAGAMAANSLAAQNAGAISAKEISSPSKLPTRAFGKTGHTLPIFGHGGSAMIEGDAHLYGVTCLPTDERIAMVRKAYDMGIRYFDTARIYQDSENVMGEALADVRDDVFIATKAMVFKPEDTRPSVEASLEALGMDHVDSMQIHGPVWERLGYDGAMQIHEELVKMKEEGLFTFIGLSGHTKFEEMTKGIATGGFDTLLIERGYVHKGFNTRHSNQTLARREQCIAKAAELNMGVVAMKCLSANVYSHNAKNVAPDYPDAKLKKLPGASLRYVLSDPRVHVLNIGISMPSDLEENLATLTGDLTYTNEDRMLLAEVAEKAYEYPIIADMKLA